MKAIDANTKIAQLLKLNPDALEAIIGIDQKFEKLRNPLLRKLLAGRTTINMASKIAGCQVQDFFNALKPLGFEIKQSEGVEMRLKKNLPTFITQLKKHQILEFDVRDILASGGDPLKMIIEKTKELSPGEALKVINTFEPVPLINMLEKQGYVVYADIINSSLVETYFYKKSSDVALDTDLKNDALDGFDVILENFKDHLITVDVRHMEMPQPMHTILGVLAELPKDFALYVYHKRIPVFLLPELADQNFDYRIKEINEGEVHLLIYRK